MLSPLILVLALYAQDGSQRLPVPVPEAPLVDASQAALELRLHDASGLTGHPQLTQHLELIARGKVPSAGDTARADFEKLERLTGQTRSSTDGLLEAIRENMQPALEEGQRLEHVGGGRMALFATAAQQSWLQDFLDDSVSVRGLVDIETILYLVPEGEAAERYARRHGEVLDEDENRAVLLHLDRSHAEKIIAPRVLVHPFSKASLSAVEEVSYVKDFEFKVLPDRLGEVADPIIGTVQDGVMLEVRPVPLAGGKLRVHADLTYQKLARPIPSFDTTLGRLQVPVTIQLPQFTRVKAAGHFDLAPGQIVLLTSEQAVEKSRVVVLLRVTTILELGQPALEER